MLTAPQHSSYIALALSSGIHAFFMVPLRHRVSRIVFDVRAYAAVRGLLLFASAPVLFPDRMRSREHNVGYHVV